MAADEREVERTPEREHIDRGAVEMIENLRRGVIQTAHTIVFFEQNWDMIKLINGKT